MHVPHQWQLLIMLASIGFLLCVAIPRLRHYALQALVIPVAFSLFSTLGGAAVVISLHELRLPVPSEYWSIVTLWLICGLCGAWLGNLAAKQLSRRFGF